MSLGNPINARNQYEEELRPKITVIGVGGAGGNAVNNMIRANLFGVDFVVANTDSQALCHSKVDPSQRIQLGLSITQGLGAGSKADVGRASAEESIEEVVTKIKESNMVFITAGMGGGTGTGAAPVIARAARECGILTVGVVTKPFNFEGTKRARIAERGIEELQQYVDTLIVIPNQNLFRIANEKTTLDDSFKMADDVLYSGVRGVTDLMMKPGLINLDFADVRAVMSEMGKAMMGTGEAQGDRRALDAAEAAISNPLLDDVSMKGAKGILINITGGYDMTLYEVDEAANRIRDEVDKEANIIFGSAFDENLNGVLRVSVVATGIGVDDNMTMHHEEAKSTLSVGANVGGGPFFTAPRIGMGTAPTTEHRTQPQNQYMEPTLVPMPAAPVAASTPTITPSASSVFDLTDEERVTRAAEIAEKILETAATTKETELVGHDFASQMEADKLRTREAVKPFPPSIPESRPSINAQGVEEDAITSPTKKRPTSLLEMFIGVGRNKVQQHPVTEETLKASGTTMTSKDSDDSDDRDLLEIPAFLRKGGGS